MHVMEPQNKENLHRKSRQITLAFAAVWGLMALLILLFESGILPTGIWVEGDRVFYYLQSFGILWALLLIPVSLKLFHLWLQKIKLLPFAEAVSRYVRLSVWRLAGLGIPAAFNLILYYLSLHTASAYISLITMMATLLCLPGRGHMQHELNLQEETPIL